MKVSFYDLNSRDQLAIPLTRLHLEPNAVRVKRVSLWNTIDKSLLNYRLKTLKQQLTKFYQNNYQESIAMYKCYGIRPM